MASPICQRLLNKGWRSYASDLGKVPEAKGIYVIGNSAGKVLYLGHSEQMQTRLKQHKSGQQHIDKVVKRKFEANGGKNLRIKWVKEEGHKCVEGDYLQCMKQKLGYWPHFNKKKGNTC